MSFIWILEIGCEASSHKVAALATGVMCQTPYSLKALGAIFSLRASLCESDYSFMQIQFKRYTMQYNNPTEKSVPIRE